MSAALAASIIVKKKGLRGAASAFGQNAAKTLRLRLPQPEVRRNKHALEASQHRIVTLEPIGQCSSLVLVKAKRPAFFECAKAASVSGSSSR